MPSNRRVSELLLHWEERYAQGQDLPPEDLCRDCPELASEVARLISGLKAVVNQVDTHNGKTDTLAPPPPDPPSDLPVVPDYEVLEELGHGGMGVVYKARHLRLDRLVALKMIRSGAHADAGELARFRAEAQVVARLQHPHIVQVYEVGEHARLPYLALEYCPGGSLDKKLRGAPLPPLTSARLVDAVARAVQAVHQAGVVHRDLKPANVLLVFGGGASALALGGEAFEPKVTDFGLAKRLDGATAQTQSGEILGTLYYMAPEQTAGRPEQIGPAVDVYALGVILYELLTGRLPIRGTSIPDTLDLIRRQEPVPPSRLQPKVPRDLDTVCLKCLQKDPTKRYATAQGLAEDLGRWQRGEPVWARPVGRAARAWRWCRRNPVVAVLLMTVALTLIVASVVSVAFGLVAGERAREARAAEATAREKAEGEAAARVEAERQLLRAEWWAYAGQIGLAQRAWQDRDAPRARDRLDATRWDFRGWEHRYLHTLFHHPDGLAPVQHPGSGLGVAFSPDGKHLANAAEDGTVRVWAVEKGREVAVLRGPAAPVWCIAFSPDGRLLAGGTGNPFGFGRSSEVFVWDVGSGRVVHALRGHAGLVWDVAFSPDGRKLATASEDRTVRLWDVGDGRLAGTLKGPSSRISSIAFSPDGRRLAGAATDPSRRDVPGEVWLWDVEHGEAIHPFKGHGGQVWGVVFSPDGRLLASASEDRTVRLWDVGRLREVHVLKGHTAPVYGIAFSPDGGHGQRLASAGADQTVRLWDTSSGQELFALAGRAGPVWGVAFSRDGKRLAAAQDRSVWLWEATRDQDLFTLPGHTRSVLTVAISPDGKRLASGAEDGTARLWDAERGRDLFTLRGHTGPVRHVAFSPDGKRLATAAWDDPGYQTIRVWDAERGHEVQTISHNLAVTCLAFSPDGRCLASGAEDDWTVRLWGASGGQDLGALAGHAGRVRALVFSPDGKWLASAGEDQTVRLWDVAGRREVFTLRGHAGTVLCVAFSPDGKRLASGAGDRTVRLWEVEQGRERSVLGGLAVPPRCLAFSRDGGQLLCAAVDPDYPDRPGEVHRWDAEQGHELLVLPTPPGPHACLVLSADGAQLLSGSEQVLKLWRLGPR